MVLEYIEGLPLNRFRAILRKNGEQVDDRASIFIASRIFAALAAAHSARDPESERVRAGHSSRREPVEHPDPLGWAREARRFRDRQGRRRVERHASQSFIEENLRRAWPPIPSSGGAGHGSHRRLRRVPPPAGSSSRAGKRIQHEARSTEGSPCARADPEPEPPFSGRAPSRSPRLLAGGNRPWARAHARPPLDHRRGDARRPSRVGDEQRRAKCPRRDAHASPPRQRGHARGAAVERCAGEGELHSGAGAAPAERGVDRCSRSDRAGHGAGRSDRCEPRPRLMGRLPRHHTRKSHCGRPRLTGGISVFAEPPVKGESMWPIDRLHGPSGSLFGRRRRGSRASRAIGNARPRCPRAGDRFVEPSAGAAQPRPPSARPRSNFASAVLGTGTPAPAPGLGAGCSRGEATAPAGPTLRSRHGGVTHPRRREARPRSPSPHSARDATRGCASARARSGDLPPGAGAPGGPLGARGSRPQWASREGKGLRPRCSGGCSGPRAHRCALRPQDPQERHADGPDDLLGRRAIRDALGRSLCRAARPCLSLSRRRGRPRARPLQRAPLLRRRRRPLPRAPPPDRRRSTATSSRQPRRPVIGSSSMVAAPATPPGPIRVRSAARIP